MHAKEVVGNTGVHGEAAHGWGSPHTCITCESNAAAGCRMYPPPPVPTVQLPRSFDRATTSL